MATICADAVQKVADAEKNHLDLKDIQIVSKVGGTLDDTELVDGLCIDQGALGENQEFSELFSHQLEPGSFLQT